MDSSKIDSNFKTLDKYSEDYFSNTEKIIEDVKTVSKFLQECESMIDTMKSCSKVVSSFRCLQSICCLDYAYVYGCNGQNVNESFLTSSEEYLQKAIDCNNSEGGLQVVKLLLQRLRHNKEGRYQQQLEISETFKVIDKDSITVWKKYILDRYLQVSWDVLYDMSMAYEEKHDSFHSILCAKLILELDLEKAKVWACCRISEFYIENLSISEAYVYAKQGADLLDWDSEKDEDDKFVKAWKHCIYNVSFCLAKMDKETMGWEYFLKDAEFGNADTMCYIGCCYAKGKGVEKNNDLAKEWFKRAYEHGSENGKKLLNLYNYDKELDKAKKYYEKQRYEDAIAIYQKILEQGGYIPYERLALCYDKLKDYVNAFKYYLKEAEKGNAFAQHNMANFCIRAQNYEEAFKWYKKAAIQGLAAAQYDLGVMFYNGERVKKNCQMAFRYFLLSAKQGYIDAQDAVGRYYYNVEQDYERAFEWCSLAAKAGVPSSCYTLGRMYEDGHGVEKDVERAFDWFLIAAKRGYVKAQFAVEQAYFYGIGVTQDYKESRKWFEKVVVQENDENACEHLGYIYIYGLGERKNYKKAFHYFFQAMKTGNMNACASIGYMYEYGKGMKRDYKMALKYYIEASKQQNALAYYRLGICYENGKGVTQNFKQAFDYFMKSANLGNADAMFSVGFYYMGFEKVKRTDYAKAVKWYTKSYGMDENKDIAMLIGVMYENGGPNLMSNLKEAEKWYEISKSEKRLERVRAKINLTT